MSQTAYKRILLKLSGEALMGDDPYGINHAVIQEIVGQIKEVSEMGVEIGVVIGGAAGASGWRKGCWGAGSAAICPRCHPSAGRGWS